MKASNVRPAMYGLTVGVDTLKFYETLGGDAEFVYGTTPWRRPGLSPGFAVPGCVPTRPGASVHEPAARGRRL